ncbi:enolase C-terminal domain-like protein [Pararhizobium sp. IMCC21322]|uniref:enolase C-terminal domain-like protein n=1 Tax=Pararhizobium sp. IMCC21322 TaxID=3067903 RepID=UPI0027426882|nr:enolase C-terminal domain-like protein [Pararhizobium sp. IMCC21322]
MIKHRITKASVKNVIVSEKTVWRHVVLETDSGLAGFGEASLDRMTASFDAGLRAAAGAVEGRTLGTETLEPIAFLLEKDLSQRTIHAALDQAVHDLAAQAADVPLCTYLNAEVATGSGRLYANINRATLDRSPEGFAAHAAQAISEGFTAVKIAAFDNLTPELCSMPNGKPLIEMGLARLVSIAEAAPDAEIMVDCHWRLDKKTAHAILPRLAEIGVVWLECPYPETDDRIDDLCDLRRVANAQGIRLCGLETHGGWDQIAPFVQGGAYDVVMPDVKHVGCLTAITDIATRAGALGVAVSLHNPTGPVSHMASTHCAAAIGSDERLEVQWRESELFFEITDPAPDINGDSFRTGVTPGLGVRLKKGIGQ